MRFKQFYKKFKTISDIIKIGKYIKRYREKRMTRLNIKLANEEKEIGY